MLRVGSINSFHKYGRYSFNLTSHIFAPIKNNEKWYVDDQIGATGRWRGFILQGGREGVKVSKFT